MNPKWEAWGQHVLAELQRLNEENSTFHAKLDTISDRMGRYNEILVRNTVTLEDHVLRTNMLQTKVDHVESEVNGLKEHISIVRKIFGFFSALTTGRGLIFLKILVSAIVSYLLFSREQIKAIINHFLTPR